MKRFNENYFWFRNVHLQHIQWFAETHNINIFSGDWFVPTTSYTYKSRNLQILRSMSVFYMWHFSKQGFKLDTSSSGLTSKRLGEVLRLKCFVNYPETKTFVLKDNYKVLICIALGYYSDGARNMSSESADYSEF